MSAPVISSQNDFALDVYVPKAKDGGKGKEPLTGATITGFLATTSGPTAVAAEETLLATVTEIDAANSPGWYRVSIDASVLTYSLMNTHFASPAECHLILVQSNGFRRYIELEYQAQLAATVA